VIRGPKLPINIGCACLACGSAAYKNARRGWRQGHPCLLILRQLFATNGVRKKGGDRTQQSKVCGQLKRNEQFIIGHIQQADFFHSAGVVASRMGSPAGFGDAGSRPL